MMKTSSNDPSNPKLTKLDANDPSHSSNDHSNPMFTKLDAFQAVQRSLQILFDNLCTFLTLGLFFVPYMGVAVYSILVAQSQSSDSGGVSVIMFVLMMVSIPMLYLGMAATIRATADIYAGERPQVGAALRAGDSHICRLFCVGCAVSIPLVGLILVGLLIVVLGAAASGNGGISTTSIVLYVIFFPIWLVAYFYVMIPFQMTPPSVVLEQGMGVMDILSRTWSLSSGRRCNIFSAMIIMGGINLLVGMFPLVGLFWSFLLSPPLSSILATVLFLNLRVEKEGLDLNGLRKELGMDVLVETELATKMLGGHEMV